MGRNARIAELEAQIRRLRKYGHLPDEAMKYIERLSELPEDSVLLYTVSGQRVSHEIGMSARVLLEKVRADSIHPAA